MSVPTFAVRLEDGAIYIKAEGERRKAPHPHILPPEGAGGLLRFTMLRNAIQRMVSLNRRMASICLSSGP